MSSVWLGWVCSAGRRADEALGEDGVDAAPMRNGSTPMLISR